MSLNYLAVNGDGLAISGTWLEDTIVEDGLSLVAIPEVAPTGGPSGPAVATFPSVGWTWTGSKWVAPIMDIDELREIRDGKLSGSDWVLQRHLEETVKTLSDSQYNEWLVYRDALRDITTEYSPLPGGPSFPVKP